MDSSLVALMMLSLLLGCGCWFLFLWAVRDGQFTDIERPKHRMLDDEELPPLPGPPPPGEGERKEVGLGE